MTGDNGLDGLLNNALAAEKCGDLDSAEKNLRALLKESPRHPDAAFLLGMLCLKSGRAREAADLMQTALSAVRRRGQIPEPPWRIAFAQALGETGDLVGALSEILRLAEDLPSDRSVAELQGQLLEKLGRNAQLLQKVGRHKEAVADFTEYLKHKPTDPRAHTALGESLLALGRVQAAADAFVRACNADRSFTPALFKAGQALLRSRRTVDAIPFLKEAHRNAPLNARVTLSLARALTALGRTAEAKPLAEKYLDRNPGNVEGYLLVGQIGLTDGDLQGAAASARRALEIDGMSSAALSLLSEAEDGDPESVLSLIDNAIASGRHGPAGKVDLHFAAARQCEALRRYSEAFSHYSAGNAVRKQILRERGDGYDRSLIEKQVDRQIAAFGPERFDGPVVSDSDLPVFIVGMARSGTTLTEQILASHPAVAGGGELSDIGRIAAELARKHGYPEELEENALCESADRYLTRLREIGGQSQRVTDKMPGNLRHVGLITRMFSKARIIHCRRNPVDTGLSCFAQNFNFLGDAWTCDLADIGHAYCQYRRLMAHWRAVLPPGRMLEIDYEETISDTEAQARRIINFVGLDWDDACLRYYDSDRAIATPSRSQVRKPIYESSVGRWRRYGDGLEPLIQALGACGCAPDEGSTKS